MGQSTDADLYYGIQLEEGFEFPWRDEEELEWEDFYAIKMGINRPKEEYSNETKEFYSEYWDKKREIVNKNSCKIDLHCSCKYPIYYIYIKESKVHASRGYPEEVKSLEVKENWDNELMEFCKLMGLPYEQPKWWLSSMWC